MHNNSPLLDTVAPTASLALTLARRYAGHKLGPIVMSAVLQVASVFTESAFCFEPGTAADVANSVLARLDVFELVLLAYGVGAQLRHSQYNGKSKQKLLPSLQTPASGSSSSSSGGGKSSNKARGSKGASSSSSNSSRTSAVEVAPNHQELLHVLLGVREVTGASSQDSYTWEVAREYTSWIHYAINKVMGARFLAVRQEYAMRYGARSGSHPVPAGRVIPWPLMLPLRLLQLELLALMPHDWTEDSRLKDPKYMLEEMLQHSGHLGQFCDRQLWEQQQPPPPPVAGSVLPPLATVKAQAQLCLEATWLQLGPVLLSLCSRSDKAAAAAVCSEDEDATPRELFTDYAMLLAGTLAWQGAALLAGTWV